MRSFGAGAVGGACSLIGAIAATTRSGGGSLRITRAAVQADALIGGACPPA